jgi:hypothetical protein
LLIVRTQDDGKIISSISYLRCNVNITTAHRATSLTTTDPSLHDGLSRLLGRSFRRSFGLAAGSSAAAEASAAGAVALRRRPAACVASAAGADARPADPPAAASSSPSCKGQGCKTESVMIGMNALIDLEYAAGTLSVECTDEQSMYSVQTAFKLF